MFLTTEIGEDFLNCKEEKKAKYTQSMQPLPELKSIYPRDGNNRPSIEITFDTKWASSKFNLDP